MTWGCAVQGRDWAVIAFDTKYGQLGWKGDASIGSKIDQVGDCYFGWAGAGSRTGSSIGSSLQASLQMSQPAVRSLYEYMADIQRAAVATIAKIPDGALRLANWADPHHPKALLMFSQPVPIIVRALSPEDIRFGTPGVMLTVPIEYEELRPPGESWRRGRLAALQWLHRSSSGYPLESVTVHDGTVTRDWLATERDLHLLIRESA